MTKLIGQVIHRLVETTSTNDDAIKRAKEAAPEGEVFFAERQTKGRGRLGRIWESEGKNLYLSFLLRPAIPIAQAPLLTLVAGVSVFETLSHFLPESLRKDLKIKWPNDIYLAGKKIGGILTEMESSAGKISWVVVGIGVNLNAEANDFSPEVQQIATSLKVATGNSIDRDQFVSKLIESFEKRYFEFCQEGQQPVLSFCDEHSYLQGKRVRCQEAKETIEGIVRGLSPEGFLLIRTDEGKVRTIVAGDVTLRETPTSIPNEP